METLPIQPTTMWINNSRKKTTGNWEKSQELHLDYHEEATTFGDDLYSIYVPGQGVTYPPWNQQLTCRPNHPPPKKMCSSNPSINFSREAKICRSFQGGVSYIIYAEASNKAGVTEHIWKVESWSEWLFSFLALVVFVFVVVFCFQVFSENQSRNTPCPLGN